MFPAPVWLGQHRAPRSTYRYAESRARRPPSPRHCYSSSPGSPTFTARRTGLCCPTTAPLHRERSGALRPGPHRLVPSGITRLSRFHSPTPSGVGWSRTPRFQPTRRRLLMPKSASRNAPCSASQLQTTQSRKYCVTGFQSAWTRQRETTIGQRREDKGGAFSSKPKAPGVGSSSVRLRNIDSREPGLSKIRNHGNHRSALPHSQENRLFLESTEAEIRTIFPSLFQMSAAKMHLFCGPLSADKNY